MDQGIQQAGSNGSLTYRLLKPEEWDRLKGLADNDDWIPNPASSAVIVAEDDGDDYRIVGFLVAQLAIHVEPVWAANTARTPEAIPTLWREMQKHLKEHGVTMYFSHAATSEIGDALEMLGMERLKFFPYVGEL